MTTKEFTAQESNIFDYTLNNNPYARGQHDTFSYLATSRLQVRLYLFALEAPDDVFNQYKEDLIKLYLMINECIKTHIHHGNRKVMDKLVYLFNDLEGVRNIFKCQKDKSQLNFSRIYSCMDHMRNCMLEGDSKPPVNLVEFNRITQRFLID